MCAAIWSGSLVHDSIDVIINVIDMRIIKYLPNLYFVEASRNWDPLTHT